MICPCGKRLLWGLLATGLGLLAMTSAHAQDDKPKADDKMAKAESAVVAEKLDNPCGIAIQPGTGHFFVACNKTIFRGAFDAKEKKMTLTKEIDGFPVDIYGKGPKYEIGPLGLGFLPDGMLVVGGGGQPDGKEIIRFYKVGKEPLEKPLDAEKDMAASAGPLGPKENVTVKGEGNFYGVAISKDTIYITNNGDDTKGWVSRVVMKGGKPGKLEPFIATKTEVSVDAPVAITVNGTGDLIVGQFGEISKPKDSLLCIYDYKTGKLKAKYETQLYDITGLAFHPAKESRTLYALDFAWMAPKEAGLFLLKKKASEGDEPATEAEAVKVTELDKPTAMVFDKDGNLFVTTLGDEGNGQVIMITGLK